MVFLIFISP